MGTLRARYHDALDSDDFAPLRGKVDLTETFDAGPPPCDDARMTGRPTPAERAALRRWIELRTAYFTGLDALQVHAARISTASAPAARRYEASLSEALRLSTAAISDLADGKLTYCQFARRDDALAHYAKWRALQLQDDMTTAMEGFGPDQLPENVGLQPGANGGFP